jgi:hypothetical protein
MDNRKSNMNDIRMDTQVVIPDIRSEIDLEGLELLKLEFWQPHTRVMCTSGTLWLTQQGDPEDHFLKAGQSFPLDQGGIILVQGLPCGKALILDIVKKPFYNKRDCSSQWDNPLETE